MDRQEFQYLMDFYRLKSIPIFYKNDYVGKVTRDLQYKKAMLVRLKDKDYAVELAFEQIHDSIEVVKRWKEKTSVDVVFESEKQTWIYDDGCGYETHHVYPKTIKTTKDMVFEGTLDEVFDGSSAIRCIAKSIRMALCYSATSVILIYASTICVEDSTTSSTATPTTKSYRPRLFVATQ